MPRIIAHDETQPIGLGDLIQALNDGRFDPTDEESFVAMGPLLARLALNRTFLGDIVVAELKDRCARQIRENAYTSQVIMLHRVSEKYFLRANMWPSPRDSVFKLSGQSPFFYNVPHDHNFSFLTVGYFGPGYWSDYYEYDYESVTGIPGEKVDLRFIERSRLEEGKVMLYRAHVDVHDQLPADEFSVSINIMEDTPAIHFRNQYRFDPKTCEIAGIITRTSTDALLALAVNHGGDNGRDLAESFAAAHPCERVRFAALRELAGAQPDLDSGLALLARGADSPSRFVAAMSAHEAARIEANRAWIER